MYTVKLVAACSSERSFSSLSRLKAHLRSTVPINTLNGLAILNIHHNNTLIPDGIVEELIKRIKLNTKDLILLLYNYNKQFLFNT